MKREAPPPHGTRPWRISRAGEFPAYREGACVLDAAGNLMACAAFKAVAQRIVLAVNGKQRRRP